MTRPLRTRLVLMRNSMPLTLTLSPLAWGEGNKIVVTLSSLARGEGNKHRKPALAPLYGERVGVRGIMPHKPALAPHSGTKAKPRTAIRGMG
jgi:hypothetical protein